MAFATGTSTRPNLDFSDDGWGPWLRLTPVPKKESSNKQAARTCTCTYTCPTHNTASYLTNDGSAALVTTCTTPCQRITCTAAHNNGPTTFLLPRPVHEVTEAVTKDKCAEDVEKTVEQGQESSWEAELVDAP